MTKKDNEVFNHIVKEFVDLSVRVKFLENYVANKRSAESRRDSGTIDLTYKMKPEIDYNNKSTLQETKGKS